MLDNYLYYHQLNLNFYNTLFIGNLHNLSICYIFIKYLHLVQYVSTNELNLLTNLTFSRVGQAVRTRINTQIHRKLVSFPSQDSRS